MVSKFEKHLNASERDLFTGKVRSGILHSNAEFWIQNDELCIANDEFCIKNDEFCIKNDGFCKPIGPLSGAYKSRSGSGADGQEIPEMRRSAYFVGGRGAMATGT